MILSQKILMKGEMLIILWKQDNIYIYYIYYVLYVYKIILQIRLSALYFYATKL